MDMAPEVAHVFLTDDPEAEFKVFQKVFPESIHLLCQFHLLQAIWRWLWNAHHKVSKGDRKHCMLMFRSMVYAENEEKFNEKLEDFENDEL